jgi:tRNA(fMet)-specific endonuclease VapC
MNVKASILDTDILSEFLRGNPKVISNVDEHLKEFGFINLSIITYYEILNGLLYKDAKKQLAKFEEFVELNKVIPLTLRMAKTAANIQAKLRKKGTEIGHTDTLIAGIAIISELQLVTNNTNHFNRIEGLEIANWTK